MRFEENRGWYPEFRQRVDIALSRMAEQVAADARDLCPVSTEGEERDGPHLVETIYADGNRVWIGDGFSPLWSWIEYGTRPHMIYPRTKRALFWPGAEHPVSAVHHPGTPEFAPMRRALHQRRRLILP